MNSKKNVCTVFLLTLFFIQNSIATPLLESNPLTLQMESEIIYSDCSLIKMRCEGVKKWNNGDVYIGKFRFGKPHGQGKITYAGGGYYEGEFYMGLPHGYGKMVYQDESTYEGEWFNGSKHGEGNYSFACGDQFYGSFHRDQIEGEGTILFSGGASYSGNWKNSMADGFGTYSRIDGSLYQGHSLGVKKDGEGMIIWDSGDTLKGNWVDGKMEDDATFIFNDGSTFVTFWESGYPLEHAIYITPEGDDFEGSQEELATMVISNNFELMESVEKNMQLAHYGFALEYKSNQRYEEAEQELHTAMSYGENDPNTEIFEMVNSEFAKIKAEQNRTGVASTTKYKY